MCPERKGERGAIYQPRDCTMQHGRCAWHQVLTETRSFAGRCAQPRQQLTRRWRRWSSTRRRKIVPGGYVALLSERIKIHHVRQIELVALAGAEIRDDIGIAPRAVPAAQAARHQPPVLSGPCGAG